MVAHLAVTFRVVVLSSIALSIAFGALMWRDTREKKDYDHLTGKITYFGKKLGDLPIRDPGLYRYLKIDKYRYPFEIYTDDQGVKMDSLKKGDIITVYFYQTDDAVTEGISRFVQFVEKDNKTYFKSGDFIVIVGFTIIVMLIMLSIWCYFMYKSGKIPY
jgi:hypothetical protein